MELDKEEKPWNHILFRNYKLVYESFGVSLAARLAAIGGCLIVGFLTERQQIGNYHPFLFTIFEPVYIFLFMGSGFIMVWLLVLITMALGNFSVRIIRHLREEIPPYRLKGYWETYIPIALFSIPIFMLIWYLVESLLTPLPFAQIFSHALWWTRAYGIIAIVLGILLWKNAKLLLRFDGGKEAFISRLSGTLVDKMDFHLISEIGNVFVYEPTYKRELGQLPGKITVQFEDDTAKIIGPAPYILKLKQFRRYLRCGA